MPLTPAQKRTLKQSAHHLKPVVIIGAKGLTENVQLEIERALLDHELIKIKIHADSRESRKAMIEEICKERDAEFIHQIGHIAIIYRENEE